VNSKLPVPPSFRRSSSKGREANRKFVAINRSAQLAKPINRNAWVIAFKLATDHCSYGIWEGRPLGNQAAAAPLLFLGLPPLRPFLLAAATFAALLDLPPSAPRRLAIQFLEPRKPISSPGR